MTARLIMFAGAVAVVVALFAWGKFEHKRRVQAEQALVSAQESVESLQAQAAAADLAQQQAKDSADKARRDAGELSRALRQARSEADEAYQRCMDYRIPDAGLERLRKQAGDGG